MRSFRNISFKKPPKKPGFLSLPRELRDAIYGYLKHTVDLPWYWKANVQWKGKCEKLIVRLHNAPMLNLLLVNSKLHYDYLGADCFKTLTAMLEIDPKRRELSQLNFSCRLDHAATVQAAFSHVRHANIFLSILPGPEFNAHQKPDWSSMAPIVNAFTVLTPKLLTLKLGIQHLDCNVIISHAGILRGEEPFPVSQRKEFVSSLPSRMAGLPLAQHGEGYRLFNLACLPAQIAQVHPQFLHCIVPGQDYIAAHLAHQISTCLYGTGKMRNRYWDKENANSCVGPSHPNCFVSHCRLIGDEDGETANIQRLTSELREWKDMRDEELRILD